MIAKATLTASVLTAALLTSSAATASDCPAAPVSFEAADAIDRVGSSNRLGLKQQGAREWDEQWDAHANTIRGVDWVDDGRRLVTSSWDGWVLLWDLESRSLLAARREHRGRINSQAISSDRRWIATAGRDGTLRVWPADLSDSVAVLTGHRGAVLDVSFGREDHLVSVGSDGRALAWSLDANPQSWSGGPLEGFGHAIGASPDGDWIVTSDWEGRLEF